MLSCYFNLPFEIIRIAFDPAFPLPLEKCWIFSSIERYFGIIVQYFRAKLFILLFIALQIKRDNFTISQWEIFLSTPTNVQRIYNGLIVIPRPEKI